MNVYNCMGTDVSLNVEMVVYTRAHVSSFTATSAQVFPWAVDHLLPLP